MSEKKIMKKVTELEPGDKFTRRNEDDDSVTVTFIERLEDAKDIFGRPVVRLQCSRSDVPGKSGWVSYGESAEVGVICD